MRKFTAILLVLTLVLSLNIWTLTAEATPQHEYSTEANSGIRHEVCTTLSGTSADTYYTGSYTFDSLSALTGDALLQQLRTLMTQTHSYKSSYGDCRDRAIYTDCENGDGTLVNLIYSSYPVSRSDFGGDSGNWNREHVWPKSLGGFKDSGAGSDLHHIRPSDSRLNTVRNNRKYGDVSSGSEAYGSSLVGEMVGGTYTSDYYEPLDNVKGDVARICLYVYARYGSQYSQCADITNVFQSVDVLLAWCALDPVDTWEMGRNEVVSAIQGNRNVFIDYPELAWLLFGEAVPTEMTTPSGKAATMTPPPVETTTPPTTQATEPTPPPTQAPTQPPVTAPPEATTPPTTQPTVPPTETTTPPTTQATEPATQPTAPATQPTTPSTQPTTEPTVPAPTVPSTDAEQDGSGSAWIWIVVTVVLLGGGGIAVFVLWKKKLPPFHK